jgi:hypothetical protein
MNDILKPGQINVQMNQAKVPFGDQLKIQIATPQGSKLMLILQPMDYDWEKNELIMALGQVDLIAEAMKGNIMAPPPKGFRP